MSTKSKATKQVAVESSKESVAFLGLTEAPLYKVYKRLKSEKILGLILTCQLQLKLKTIPINLFNELSYNLYHNGDLDNCQTKITKLDLCVKTCCFSECQETHYKFGMTRLPFQLFLPTQQIF